MYGSEETSLLAMDFQKYVISQDNAPTGKRHGTTGYHESIFTGDFLDESAVRIPINVSDHLAYIFRLPLKNQYGEEGLVSRCKRLGLYDIAPGTSKRVLAARLYVYHDKGGGEEGLAAAKQCKEDDRYKRAPVPRGVNLSASLNSDLLFGSEGSPADASPPTG
jgi:hypothetical protein